ncbi:transmembrane channel-like protein 6 isoform X1 [Conger conger]|uniref:transmembrane channel-like protein 6 isoform X1 n=1 Tax=Conger conger TaxID=82655 RepID=UPI002A5AA81A|nr:transmembrane channel-like protein 6 isoform X1 [Conger conger]XP_061088670.1 transmembrane channel-like protein 6 isoform X1 [Conger conger]
MARHANLYVSPHDLEATLQSPRDEDVLHNSFSQLIEEQSHGLEALEALEMEDLTEEQRDHLTYLRGPAVEGRGQRRGRARDQEDGRVTDPLMEAPWSSDTLRVLSAMPSRTIGRSRGAIISQYYNRTMQLRRRRQTRPAIRDFSLRSARPSIRGYGVEMDVSEEESKKEQLVNNLQNLSLGDRVSMLRGMPLSMAEKNELRKRAYNFKEGRSITSRQISCFSRLKYYFIIALRQGWYSWLSFLHSLQLWQVALKRVSGRFGTGVLSYFDFLKTLLLFNIFLFLVYGLFLLLPQAIHRPGPEGTQGPCTEGPCPSFTGLELLTGGGSFEDTVMYYGHYANHTLTTGCRPAHNATGPQPACARRLPYNMPLAYFFTIGVSFFITCIILVYSMSKSFGRSFHISKSHGCLAAKVFSSWDFKVMKRSSVSLQAQNICTQLKELLGEVRGRAGGRALGVRVSRWVVQALAWLMCVGSTTACTLAVFYFSQYMHQDQKTRAHSSLLHRTQEQEASLLALPVVVSSFNLLLPGFYNTVGWMEEYDSPSVRAYIAIFRNLLLKVSLLAVLCYHWLGRIAQDPKVLGLQCWESFVGQELYRFLLMDFIFTLLDTFFGEFLWKLFSQKVLKRKRKPEFDIARNVLELIYGQTLAWLGVLFSPLLPAVQIVKLLLLFYIKKASLMLNCQAPRRAWRASQMSTVFITLLCFPSFLGAAVSVTYTMWM